MSTYVIGDVHGCFETLLGLIDQIQFDRASDRLWFVGDLVNRGPQPLEVLRWVFGLGENAKMVLGNHDLHLLGAAARILPIKKSVSWLRQNQAPDITDLLEWLRHLPLFYWQGSDAMVHAGLLPQWSLEEAKALSQEVEFALGGANFSSLLQAYATQCHSEWNDGLTGVSRLSCILQIMTQLRTCGKDGSICLEFAGPPDMAPAECFPWFAIPSARKATDTVYFGHWAALGFYQGGGVIGLDGGCAWGGELFSVRLEDGMVFSQPNLDSHEA
jgi:bis(5'-nucleosyl)-tetraphosphatase (symmetrical)